MTIPFSKYHGAGNDFILIDNRENLIKLYTKEIKKLCNRRFGIGADGLMLLERSSDKDFRMVYFNADGKEGSMCGNGGRCIVAFSKEIGIIKEHDHFGAVDGSHEAFILSDEVNLKMTTIKNIQKFDNEWFLDTGSPHAVKIVKDINAVNVALEGKKLRFDQRFGKNGTNVNFIEVNNSEIDIRTYERGVEEETLACGTGAVASAIIAHQNNPKTSTYSIKALGGNLVVSFEKIQDLYTNVWLKGPAVKVFEGKILI